MIKQILSELINFYFPRNHQKTFVFPDDMRWNRTQFIGSNSQNINPFVPNESFLDPLKTSENRKVF